MKKINVIGTTGSGKSTFSKALAEEMGCKYIQMDQLFWKPNWGETPDEEFFAKIKQETSIDSWVLDGNFSRTEVIKWENVDAIIWLDYSYLRNFFQLLKRTIKRAWVQEELWPGTGNVESFRRSFLSKNLFWFGFLKAKRRIKSVI